MFVRSLNTYGGPIMELIAERGGGQFFFGYVLVGPALCPRCCCSRNVGDRAGAEVIPPPDKS